MGPRECVFAFPLTPLFVSLMAPDAVAGDPSTELQCSPHDLGVSLTSQLLVLSCLPAFGDEVCKGLETT